jgi:hypothetical protein
MGVGVRMYMVMGKGHQSHKIHEVIYLDSFLPTENHPILSHKKLRMYYKLECKKKSFLSTRM